MLLFEAIKEQGWQHHSLQVQLLLETEELWSLWKHLNVCCSRGTPPAISELPCTLKVED